MVSLGFAQRKALLIGEEFLLARVKSHAFTVTAAAKPVTEPAAVIKAERRFVIKQLIGLFQSG